MYCVHAERENPRLEVTDSPSGEPNASNLSEAQGCEPPVVTGVSEGEPYTFFTFVNICGFQS